MKKLRVVSTVLLALTLLVFGGNYFVRAFELPPGDGSSGSLMLEDMREAGLMTWVSLSHVVVGVLLLVPRTRYAAALFQLHLTLGIVFFHAEMLPAGLGPALFLLVTNVAILADRERFEALGGGGA